jgi:hypothetical protein
MTWDTGFLGVTARSIPAAPSKVVGQIPANWSQDRGDHQRVVYEATEAALDAYPGSIVDRFVELGDGGYNVHDIGVNWPHHTFVNRDFKVVGVE